MAKRLLFGGVLLLAAATLCLGQTAKGLDTSRLSFGLTPGLSIPVGYNADLFGLGGDALLEARYRLPSLPILFVNGQIGYGFSPITSAESLSLLTGEVGVGAVYEVIPKLSISGYGSGGVFFAAVNSGGGSSWNPFAGGGAGISYRFIPSLSADLGVAYRYFFGLSSKLTVGLGASYHLPAPAAASRPTGPGGRIEPLKATPRKKKTQGIDVADVQLSVFPVLFKYYDTKPVGRAVLVNYERDQIDNVRVTFFVKQYMDNPKDCEVAESIPGRSEAEVQLYSLLTSKVLEISEDTKVSANITVEYSLKGKQKKEEFVETLRFYNRNAVTWDDDRKAAAFVTAKDTAILKFSKNVAGMVKDTASKALNANLLAAIALHESLTLYDISYVIDPSTPYVEYSKNKQAVDYLQFPNQTMEFKAGDCDDLSILYCALLESVGIRTAFVTVPEHIFMAFSLDMTAEESAKTFSHSEDLIINGGTAWIPLEVTERKGGFLAAWQLGARQWREQSAKGQAGFFTLSEAWKLYEPVGFTASTDTPKMPDKDKVVLAYLQEVMKYIDREILPQKEALVSQINKTGSLRTINKLGVLYARFGKTAEAEAEFRKVLAKTPDDVPALLNLGSLSYLKGDMKSARQFYDRAAKQSPNNPSVLLALARVRHEAEDYAGATAAYNKLKAADPALAGQFAYLGMQGSEAARAADASRTKGVMAWNEE
jgi:tetratricopeptide (TPR) repeat protein